MAKIGRPIKFVIRLTPAERTRLKGMIHCGIGAVNSALNARILLKTDVSENEPGWSDERIAEALETSLSTVLRTQGNRLNKPLTRAFCKTQANSSSDIASLHDDWILVSTLHDSLDLAAKFRPDSTKNPFKPSKRVKISTLWTCLYGPRCAGDLIMV